ncbi:probable flavin-containing monooxygenase 1 [Triticum urartu]|uniref:Flavin-containing monooxygenase n=3 Tax=Triticum TaxID=4564 RepID=A0A3B6KNU2_WHEAT|nr:probable flavin-containing monooxygenase 1 [Triticum aestivum]XP_048531445.1 probable flavin-containing monooxygenase 1 [Triticum urartu]
MDRKRVGVVGAGVSGLAACKHALDKGFSPVVFEADDTIGGVWAHTLQSTRLQAPTTSFRFSDLAWPASVTATYPGHGEVMEYLRLYACEFDLLKCIKFSSQVLGVEYFGATEEEIMEWKHWSGDDGKAFRAGKDGGWSLKVKDLKIGTVEVFQVDFLILCIGRHSGTPNIPEFPVNKGPEFFKGKILHSMDYSYMDNAAEFVKGKSVTIIGSGKSAFDIAAEVAKVNGAAQPCTMIYRTKHWRVDKFSMWGVNLNYFYLNRISQLFVHKPGEGFLHYMLASALSPLRWAITKVIETYLKQRIPLQKHGMVPDYSFSFAMSSCLIAMLPKGFYDRVDDGSIILKKSKRFSFCSDGINLEDGNESIKSDIIILATGFRGDQKLRDIFTANWCRNIVAGSSDTSVPLYRECIHPRIPQLAIVGYSESLTDIYVSERVANWVIHFLAGGFQMPSVRRMEESVAEWTKYKNLYNGKYFRRSCISTVNIWFNDLLCQDIGCNPRRKEGFLAEWFQPYGPADYAGLF